MDDVRCCVDSSTCRSFTWSSGSSGIPASLERNYWNTPSGIARILPSSETDPRAQRQLEIYRKTAVLLRAACAEGFYRDVPEKLVATVQRDRPSPLVPRRWMLAMAASLLLGVFGFAAGYGIGTWPA
jgi:hypothetical protein